MDFRKIVPHLIATGILLAVAALFFAPNAFSGKVLPQSDNVRARGMTTEIQAYNKQEGHAPLWTNSAFGGMPSFQIYTTPKGNLTKPFFKSLFLWTDYTSVWAQVFVAMFCMYLLLGALQADWRVAVFGALACGITTYNIDILEAGHSTKMMALAMAPGIFAGVVWAFNGRWLLGGGVAALFLAMQIYANHVQITYYSLLLVGVYMLVQLVDAFRHKAFGTWGKAFAISSLAIILGFGSNLSKLWPTYEYGQETIRGGSELKSKSGQGGGLTKEYAFGYSYGLLESFTLLVPHYAGGGANESYKGTELYKSFTTKYREQVPIEQASRQAGGLLYSGDEGVGTAIYFGSIICFLFFLGAFLVPGSAKWWLVSGALLMVSISWAGRFFVNQFFFDYLPMFNKFRALSMALGMGQLCFAALAALGLQKLADPDITIGRKKRALYIGAGISAGLLLIASATSGPSQQALAALAQTPDLLANLQADHAAYVRGDVLRSFGFIAVAAAIIWFYLQGSLKAGLMVAALASFALADQWLVCTRTITTDDYRAKGATIAPPAEAAYDQQIKQDTDPHYRVLDLARGGLTGNAVTSCFHKSMSGYHAAKLQRYQEVIDSFLGPDKLGDNLPVAGMFNCKYIVSPKGEVIRNPEAVGHAWFVRHFTVLPTGDAEIQALKSLSPKDSAVVQQSFAAPLQGLNIQFDSANTIRLTSYHPDKMVYEYSARTEQLALFPEIYYPPAKGWKTYINDQPAADFIKANYLLRAMRLPAGQKVKLEMRFEPRSWYVGENISLVASALTLLLFFGGLFWWFRRHPLEDPNRLTNIERPVAPRPTVRPASPPAPARGKVVPKKGKR